MFATKVFSGSFNCGPLQVCATLSAATGAALMRGPKTEHSDHPRRRIEIVLHVERSLGDSSNFYISKFRENRLVKGFGDIRGENRLSSN